MKKIHLVALALSAGAFLPSCAALAVGAGSVLVWEEVKDSSVFVGQLNTDARITWAQVKTTLSHMSLDPIEVDDGTRTARAEIDDADVTVVVEVYDLDQSLVRVSAKKYLVSNGEIARRVFDRLVDDVNESRKR